jgi:nitroreductase
MINQAILNRRSVRAFTDQPVSDEQIREILKAAQFAPSAMNKRGTEFVVVKELAIKEALLEITGTNIKQEAVKTAPVVLIPLVNTKVSLLPIQDLTLAIENIFIQVAELGLGAFWKNISTEEAEEIKKLLNIPEHYTLVNVIPVGQPQTAVKPHSDEEFVEEKIHWGGWQEIF